MAVIGFAFKQDLFVVQTIAKDEYWHMDLNSATRHSIAQEEALDSNEVIFQVKHLVLVLSYLGFVGVDSLQHLGVKDTCQLRLPDCYILDAAFPLGSSD